MHNKGSLIFLYTDEKIHTLKKINKLVKIFVLIFTFNSEKKIELNLNK